MDDGKEFIALTNPSLENITYRLNQLEEDYIVQVLGYQIVMKDGAGPYHCVLVELERDV